MTPSAARSLFGLAPDEDPRPHLAEFRLARERIAEMVRTAADERVADRYQVGLIEFDQALAAILESLEEPEVRPPPPAKPLLTGSAPPRALLVAGGPAPPPGVVPAPAPRRRSPGWLMWLAVMILLAAGGAYVFDQYQRDAELRRQARVADLEREGAGMVEQRRWQEASKAFAEIEQLAPGSEVALFGRRSVEAGMAEELTQFTGYWTGQAVAALEAGRLDEAQAAIQRVRDKFPADQGAVALEARIADARAKWRHDTAIATARQQLDDRRWDAAISTARQVIATTPDDADAQSIMADAAAGQAKQSADLAKAKDLLARAVARDQGRFDGEALAWLREAAALAPDDEEVAARLEKMASYTRTLRVPGDYATPGEALAIARDRDRIVLAEQTWKGPLVIHAAVELQGAGSGKTLVTCRATEGCPIIIAADAKGARVSGITFRHEAFHALGQERFSAALVAGGRVTFVDCRFSDANGHGLVVIDKGSAVASHCRFSDNGWNGVSVSGAGSTLDVSDSEALNNFGHGIESWDGAAITLSNNRCEGNCRNGIHADNGAAAATITGNQLVANREFGLVLGSAGSGSITGNAARANLLGGMVIRKAAAAVAVTRNDATLNQGPGLVLEKGLSQAPYATNTTSKNTAEQMLANADLDQYVENAEAPSNKKEAVPPTPPTP